MFLAVAILYIPIFFFPIHDAFGIAKLGYLSLCATLAAYQLARMEVVKIPYALPLLAYLVAVGLSVKNVVNWYQYFLEVGTDLAGITVMVYMANLKMNPMRLLKVITVIAFFLSLFPLLLILSPSVFYQGRPDWAWESTMGNTGFAAGMVAALFPIVAWMAWKKRKVWMWATVGLMMVHLNFALSRTPIMSLLVVGLVALGVTVIRGTARRMRMILAGVLLVTVMVAVSVWLMEVQETRKASIDVRVMYLKGTWNIIKDHPVFGAGRGQLQVVALPYMAKVGDSGLFFVDHAHNDYAEILAELGPLGLAGLLGIVLMALFRSILEPRWQWAVGLAFLTLALNALTFFPLHTVAQAVYFWAYAGLLAREA